MDFQPLVVRSKKSSTSHTTQYREAKRDKNNFRILSSNSPYPKEVNLSAAFQKEPLEIDSSPPISITRKVHRKVYSLNESTVSFGKNNRTGSQPDFAGENNNNNSPISDINSLLQKTASRGIFFNKAAQFTIYLVDKSDFIQDFQVLTFDSTKTRYAPESRKMTGLFHTKLHPVLNARGQLDMKALLKLQRREINRTTYLEKRPEVLHETPSNSVDSARNIARLREDISDILTASRVKSTLARTENKEQAVSRNIHTRMKHRNQHPDPTKAQAPRERSEERDIVIDYRNTTQKLTMSEIDSRVVLEIPLLRPASKATRGKEKQISPQPSPPKEKIAKNQMLKMIVAHDKIYNEQAVRAIVAQREELLFSKMTQKYTTGNKQKNHLTEEEMLLNNTLSPLRTMKTSTKFRESFSPETDYDFARVSRGEFIYSRIEDINSLMIKDTKAKILTRDKKSENLKESHHHHHGATSKLRQSRERNIPSKEELHVNRTKKMINQVGIIPTIVKEPSSYTVKVFTGNEASSVALSVLDKKDGFSSSQILLNQSSQFNESNQPERQQPPPLMPVEKESSESESSLSKTPPESRGGGGSSGEDNKRPEKLEKGKTTTIAPTAIATIGISAAATRPAGNNNNNKALENLFRKSRAAKKAAEFSSSSTKKLEKSATGSTSKVNLRDAAKLVENDQEVQVLQKRLEEYMKFLLKINFSFGIVIKQDLEKPGVIYKYYIGAGNNSVLLCNLMKKRWWWTQTENINSMRDLNFMWTQKKSNKFFELFGSRRKNPYEGLNMIVGSDEFLSEETNNDPLKKLLTDREIRILGDHSYSPEDLCQKKENERFQVIHDPRTLRMCNHLENHFHLSNKKALLWNMRSYFNGLKQDVFKHLPLTFHIQNGLEDHEFLRFINYFNTRQENISKQSPDDSKKLHNIWIIKPGEETNRGNGIRLSDDLEQIKQMIGKNEVNGKKRTYLIQDYIVNPLLYRKRKFDIRCYVLVSSINTHLKAYWYEEGYVRTSSKEFSLSNIANREIHLTNNAIQEKAKDYGKYEEGNKVTYADFQKYLDGAYDKKVSFDKEIYPQLKSLAADTIKSVYGKIDPYRKEHCFEVYGLDFMIDTDFKVWLIEVNTNPDITTCCPILTRLIPNMVENALRLTIDPMFPPPGLITNKNQQIPWENAIENNKFELIFDEIEDAPGLQSIFDIYKKSPSASQANLLEENMPFMIEPEEDDAVEEYPDQFGKSDFQNLIQNRE